MRGLLECCYELMQLELRAKRPEHLISLFSLYEMIDLQHRYGIIEERGWVTKDGKHFYIADDGGASRARLKKMIMEGLVTLDINESIQNRHYIETNEYNSFLAIGVEKSYFTVSQSELQDFLRKNAATGEVYFNSSGVVRERMYCGKSIGFDTRLNKETSWVTVFYSKSKTHLSPYSPMSEEES